MLTRYALRVAERSATDARPVLAELAQEIDRDHHAFALDVLATSDRNVPPLPGGMAEMLNKIATACRHQLERLQACRVIGGALEPPTLPEHITTYPTKDPLAVRIGGRGAPGVYSTIWFDAIRPEDLEAVAAWLRHRKAVST